MLWAAPPGAAAADRCVSGARPRLGDRAREGSGRPLRRPAASWSTRPARRSGCATSSSSATAGRCSSSSVGVAVLAGGARSRARAAQLGGGGPAQAEHEADAHPQGRLAAADRPEDEQAARHDRRRATTSNTVAAGAGRVWVGSADDQSVLRIDPRTNEVTGRVDDGRSRLDRRRLRRGLRGQHRRHPDPDRPLDAGASRTIPTRGIAGSRSARTRSGPSALWASSA